MKRLFHVFVATVFTLANGCASAEGGNDLMINARFAIAKDELNSIRKEALAGSRESAQRLYDYYSMIVLDEEQASYWAQISAENRNPHGQHAYGFVLLQKKDEESRERALYWIRLAASQGISASVDLLRRIEAGKPVP